jgi:hypothetical protein
MEKIGRRGFFGVAGLGTLVATAGSTRAYASETGEYKFTTRLGGPIGLGRGEAASLAIAWLPRPERQQLPPVKMRLVIFAMDGKVLAENEVAVSPFTGASVDFEKPKEVKRQQVFGYIIIEAVDEQLAAELFGGMEVFDVSSGRVNIFAAPVGVA